MSYRSTSTPVYLPDEQPRDLAITWRERAAELRRTAAAEAAARAYEVAADELTAMCTQQGDRLLSVAEAAALVGRHRDTVGNAIRNGRLQNYGGKFRPRVKFSDVVGAFPSRGIVQSAYEVYNRPADARASLEARRGE